MENVLLQFRTKDNLLTFLRQTTATRCELDLENLTLSSSFSEADIELAIDELGAFVFAESLIY